MNHLYDKPHREQSSGLGTSEAPALKRESTEIDFSLFYFYSDQDSAEDRYRLLIEGAKFADRKGFEAVWTPERHFHEFGGIYPNPSVTGAALAMITERISIRAGSVVVPLHNPVRVSEEWAVVDNLSGGRVGISFASGWHADDFVLSPENYADRKGAMISGIDTVQRLWRGEVIKATNGVGKDIEVRIFPRPIQHELPTWITCSGSPDTYELAGRLGGHVLTHLLGQSIDELGAKIELYRESLANNGHDPRAGRVTLMMHTFLGEDVSEVREKVRGPFSRYLASSIGLIQKQLGNPGGSASATPWRRTSTVKTRSANPASGPGELTQQEKDELVAYGFERYFETAALFGTPESCRHMVDQLKEVGVDEIACLVDFGVDVDSAIEGLRHIDTLKNLSNPIAADSPPRFEMIDAFNEQLETCL